MACRIRLARASDAEPIRVIYEAVVTATAITFELDPPTTRQMAGRIAETLEQRPWLVCEEAGALLGYAHAGRHRVRAAYQWSVEPSVYVSETARRRGVGRALYKSLFEVLALQGFCNAYAGITLPNPASVALHESFGFERIGVYRAVGFKLGAWHDVGWWALELRQRPADPPPPIQLRDLPRSGQLPEALASGEPHVRV